MTAYNKRLTDFAQIVPVIEPVDLDDGANSGDWINMRDFESVTFIVTMGAGTAANDPTITLQEAQDNSGANSQNLAVIDEVFEKQAASALTGVGVFTKQTQTAAATYTNGTSGEQANLWVVHVRKEEMSINDDYTHLTININDVGAAKLGAVIAILHTADQGKEIIASAID